MSREQKEKFVVLLRLARLDLLTPEQEHEAVALRDDKTTGQFYELPRETEAGARR